MCLSPLSLIVGQFIRFEYSTLYVPAFRSPFPPLSNDLARCREILPYIAQVCADHYLYPKETALNHS